MCSGGRDNVPVVIHEEMCPCLVYEAQVTSLLVLRVVYEMMRHEDCQVCQLTAHEGSFLDKQDGWLHCLKESK